MTKDASLTDCDIAKLSGAIDGIGTAGFPRLFCEFCADLAGADAIYLTAFFDHARPAEIYATKARETARRDALDAYLDVAFVLDPFFLLFQQKSGDRVDGLREIAPDDFKRSQYYAQFFRQMNLADECGVMLQLAEDAALFLSLGVVGRGRTNLRRLRAFLPLIGSLARRHWTVLTPDRFDGTGRIAAHLETAFAMFGSSVLSPREGEIVRMILKGHSSKAIAIRFDNSPETIKVHRKRIYAKLRVASQVELLSVFLAALSKMPPMAKGDPLEYLPK